MIRGGAVSLNPRPVRRAIARGDLPDPFTRSLYKVAPYQGCAHGCRYCDGRAERYYVSGNFERDIVVRRNIVDLFARELAQLRESGMIAFGSGTTDPYQPCEKDERITAACAAALAAPRWSGSAGAELWEAGNGQPRIPAQVMTKSALVLRDIDLWRRVNETAGFMLLVSMASLDEELRVLMEPGASSYAERLETLRAFKAAGCFVGILAMPLLPGLSDNEASMRRVYEAGAAIGVDFLMPGGLTLRPGRQKACYLSHLGSRHPELLSTTQELYAEERISGSPHRRYARELIARSRSLQEEYGIPWLLPHSATATLLPPHDSLRILLRDMVELYESRGTDTRRLRTSADRYDAWLLALKRTFRRSRTRPWIWLVERFDTAAQDGELAAVLDNPRLARFVGAVLFEGARLNYRTLHLE